MVHVEPIEHASADELRASQLIRLRDTCATRTSAFHITGPASMRRAFTRTTFSELEDISRFPLTTKEDLRQNYPFGMFAVPMEQIVRIHASSGTTGKPTVVGYTKNDIDTWSLLNGSIDPSGGGTCIGQDPHRVWLWLVHRRPGRSLRRRASRRGGHSGQRRVHRTAGADHQRFQAGYHHGDAVIYAGDRR